MLAKFGLFLLLGSLSLSAQATVSKMAGRLTLIDKAGGALTLNGDTKNIVYRKNNDVLTLENSNNQTIYTLTRTTPQRIYKLIHKETNQRLEKTGLLILPNKVRYSVDCAPEDVITTLNKDVSSILETVQADNAPTTSSRETTVAKRFLDKSCQTQLGKPNSLQLEVKIKNLLDPQRSYLSQCFNSPVFAKEVEKAPDLKQNVDHIVNTLMSDAEKIKNKQFDFQVSCEPKAPGSKVKGKYEHPRIILPVDGKQVATDSCSSLESVVAHEYIHRSGVNSEEAVQALENICLSINSPGKVSEGSCKITDNFKSCRNIGSGKKSCDTNKSNMLEELKETSTIAIKKEQAAAQEALANNSTDLSLKKPTVSESSWQQVTQDTTGKTAAKNPEVQRLTQEAQENHGKMANLLNATLSTIEPAQAEGSSRPIGNSLSGTQGTVSANSFYAASSSSSSRSPASDSVKDSTKSSATRGGANFGTKARVGGKDNFDFVTNSAGKKEKYYTVEEYLVDVGVNKGAQAQRVVANSNVRQNIVSLEGDLLSDTSTSDSATNSGGMNRPSLRGNSAGSTGSVSGGGSGAGVGSQGVSSRRSGGVTSSRSISSVESPQKNPVLEALQKSTVTGEDYNKVRANYRKSAFSRRLAEEGISIFVQSENVYLGSRREQSQIRFVDDGKKLQRITSEKK